MLEDISMLKIFMKIMLVLLLLIMFQLWVLWIKEVERFFIMVFWNNLIGFLVGKVDLNDVNLKTGSIIDIANRSIVLDKAGFFNIGNSEFAVNLLDIKESDINFISPVGDIKKAGNIKLEAVSSDYEFKLEVVLLILALLLVIIEIIYIKYRGEI